MQKKINFIYKIFTKQVLIRVSVRLFCSIAIVAVERVESDLLQGPLVVDGLVVELVQGGVDSTSTRQTLLLK